MSLNICFIEAYCADLYGNQKSLLQDFTRLKKIYKVVKIICLEDGKFYQILKKKFPNDIILNKINSRFNFYDKKLLNFNIFTKILFFYHLIRINIKIFFQLKKNKINIIQCNNLRSTLFCIFCKLLIKFRLIVYVKGEIENYFIAKFIFLFTDKICTLSNYSRLLLIKKFNINKDKISILPIGVKFPVKKNAKFKKNKNEFIFTYLGILSEEKGILILIHATLKLLKLITIKKKIKLYLIGNYKNIKIKNEVFKILNLKENYKYKNNFIILKWQKNTFKYLNKSNVFVLPSYSEGMPRSIIEAIFMKNNIIASNVGEIKALKNKLNIDLVKAGSITSLYHKMHNSIFKKKINYYFNHNFAKKNFSLNNHMLHLKKIYENT